MFFDWVVGVMFRPSATFGRAREELRFGYWWIVLTVFTLDCVLAIYDPVVGTGTDIWDTAVFVVVMQDLILFDLQALMLLGAGRLAGWQVSWAEATKYSGLLWSVALVEDLIIFLPSLRGMLRFELWTTGICSLWYLIVGMVGLRKVSGLPVMKALLVSLLSFGVWRGALFAISYSTLTHPPVH